MNVQGKDVSEKRAFRDSLHTSLIPVFVTVIVSVFISVFISVFVSVFEYVFKPQLFSLARLVWTKLDVSVFAFLFLIQNYWQSCCVLRIAVE